MKFPSHRFSLLIVGSLAALVFALSATGAETFYEADFDSPAAVEGWSGIGAAGAQLMPGFEDSQSLSVQIPVSEGPGHRNARIRLPLESLRGTRVRVEAMVRAEGVSNPPNPWNGIKVMLHAVSPEEQNWQQQNSVFGTFDWKPVRFLASVPKDATGATLILGLEMVTGRVWFDDVKITVVRRRRSADSSAKLGPVYKGHDLPRLRGAMIGPHVDADDLRVLGGEWKANHVRWQFIWGGFPHGPADDGDLDAYNRWIDSQIERLDSLLPVCKEVGIHVLIDLVNEPVEGMVGEGVMDWHALATKTAQAVRAIDPDHAIIIEPAPWGSPSSLEFFEPIDVERVVYSVHMYQPHNFTHQGVYDAPVGVTYPGEVDGRHWDKDALRKALKPAIDYQRDYGVHIYIGEFSAIRWAPGTSAHDYLRDVIDVMEENHWDWAYHAFREWDGWSVEHGPDKEDRSRAEQPTDRQKLLTSWFEKNK